jgi:hypothetical protein
MRKKEQLLWDNLKAHATPSMWLQRMENVSADGFPDVYVGGSGRWIELKAPSDIPKRPGTPLLGSEGLRTSQKNWHIRNLQAPHAPLSYILIRTIDRELILAPGSLAAVINDLPLAELRAVSLADDWFGINVAVMS